MSVPLKGLIVFIAEAAAPLMGALKESIQELCNIKSPPREAGNVHSEEHVRTLNASGNVLVQWRGAGTERRSGQDSLSEPQLMAAGK